MSIKTNKMASMPVRQLVISMAFPAMISMSIQAMYNIVDSIYVSRISEEALTAVSLAFPLQLLIVALMAGTGAGVTSLISRRLGEKNHQAASYAASHGLMINAVYSVSMMILGLFFARRLVSLFTSDLYLIDLTTQYISIIMIFSFGRLMSQAGMSILQGTGDMIRPMKAMLIGAISNIILDPILIFGWFGLPALGIRGAAIATILGQMLSFSYIIIVLSRGKPEVHLIVKGFKPDKGILKDIYIVGLPGIIMQSLASVMISVFNIILISFTPTAVAVLGIYFKLQSIIIMPMFGLAQGYMPIMGFNYGAKNKARMIQALKTTLMLGVAFMTLGTIILVGFPVPLLRLFDASEEMITLGVPALRRVAMGLPIAAAGITFSVTFQAIGKGYVSLIASFIRQMIVILPVAYLLSRIVGLSGVWFSFFIAEIVAIVIIGPWLIKELRRTFKLWQEQEAHQLMSHGEQTVKEVIQES